MHQIFKPTFIFFNEIQKRFVKEKVCQFKTVLLTTNTQKILMLKSFNWYNTNCWLSLIASPYQFCTFIKDFLNSYFHEIVWRYPQWRPDIMREELIFSCQILICLSRIVIHFQYSNISSKENIILKDFINIADRQLAD